MRKIAVALLLIVTACGGEATPATTIPPSTLATTTTSSPTTTSTTASTTTTTDASVATLPPAGDPSEIPWDEVGAGWYVALYDASLYDPDRGDVGVGPTVMYLVSSEGERYAITEWVTGEMKPWRVLDVRGEQALVVSDVIELVDLATGDRTVVWDPPAEEREALVEWEAWLSATGDAIGIVRTDGATEWVDRRTPQGESLAVLFEQPAAGYPPGLFGLELPNGSATVIAHRSGITIVDPTGDPVRELWAPPETICQPLRWWTEGVFLAVCDGQTEQSAPVNEYGPHTYYGRLWLLNSDRSEGVAMTTFPDEPPVVSDFGYRDARPVGDETLVQWRGDCGAAAVAWLDEDGSAEFMQVDGPTSWTPMGVEMITASDASIAVRTWDSCGGGFNAFFTIALDGSVLVDLVPAGFGHVGVIDARGL